MYASPSGGGEMYNAPLGGMEAEFVDEN